MTSKAGDCWVVYSPNESAIGDSAGFWSNEFGWVQFDQAYSNYSGCYSDK